MRSLRKLVIATAIAAGAAALVPITARADIPGEPGWHYLAIYATPSVHYIQVFEKVGNSPLNHTIVYVTPGQWNQTGYRMKDGASYKINCYDMNRQIGRADGADNWTYPKADGNKFWYSNTGFHCDLNG